MKDLFAVLIGNTQPRPDCELPEPIYIQLPEPVYDPLRPLYEYSGHVFEPSITHHTVVLGLNARKARKNSSRHNLEVVMGCIFLM